MNKIYSKSINFAENNSSGWYANLLIREAGLSGHFKTKEFIDNFAELQKADQKSALRGYKFMTSDPKTASIKRIRQNPSPIPVYSAEVGQYVRAMAVKVGNCYIWYWIGLHERYNEMLKTMPPMKSIQNVINYMKKNKWCNI
jgi:hypothetical protein